MGSSYGENIKMTIFGQSHSPAIGMTLEGVMAGESFDAEKLNHFMHRRAPGRNDISTPRKEADVPEFLSGVLNCESTFVTCGTPITAIIRNTNTRSQDYSMLKRIPRPGHADYTAEVKYNGFQDFAGGGHFSGRLTAPLCIAGGIVKQLLEKNGIYIFARISSIGSIEDKGSLTEYANARMKAMSKDDIEVSDEINSANSIELSGKINPVNLIENKDFPVLDDEQGKLMIEKILQVKAEGDSIGGTIECCIVGLPAGLGDPMFDGMENRIASAMFGIPAVKGIEFGAGFEASKMLGSQNNDAFCIENGTVRTKTNNAGGILGGITNGMPVTVRVAVKPTPSIAKEQDSVDLEKMENAKLVVEGRHDPCIVQRAVPCVEAAAALAIYDAWVSGRE